MSVGPKLNTDCSIRRNTTSESVPAIPVPLHVMDVAFVCGKTIVRRLFLNFFGTVSVNLPRFRPLS